MREVTRAAVVVVAILAACTPKKPKAGDVCGAADEGTYVCTSATTALLCKGERRVDRECRGPKGCANAACDRSVGREGDACSEANAGYYDTHDTVCSENKAALLSCRDGKLALDTPCRGPKGCTGAGPVWLGSCDQTFGEAGDPCNRHLETSNTLGACSVDKTTKLACDADGVGKVGKLVVKKTCPVKGCELGRDPSFPVPVCDGVAE